MFEHTLPKPINARDQFHVAWFVTVARAYPDFVLDAHALPGSNVTNRELIDNVASLCRHDQRHVLEHMDMGWKDYDEAVCQFMTSHRGYDAAICAHRAFAVPDLWGIKEHQKLFLDVENSTLRSWARMYSRDYRNTILKRLPWRIREHYRMTTDYKKLPWLKDHRLSPVVDHFAHISTEDPSMVAFTETVDKGERDIQTRIRPGRYLRRFYPQISDTLVAELQAEMLGDYELKFAVTADEIEEVYLNGPSSCMSHEASSYAGHCHPVRVYGDSDIQLAYMTAKGSKKPKARALVWPEKKAVGRCYGDWERLGNLLKAQGYTNTPDGYELSGARIRRIVDENGDGDRLIMPYIDGPQSYGLLDKEWVTIGGNNHACWTNGTDHEDTDDGCMCEHCEDSYPEEDMRTVYITRRRTEYWCYHCADNNSNYVESIGEYVHGDSSVEVIIEFRGNRPVTEYFADWEDCWYFCDGLGEYVHDDIPSFSMEHGETWCEHYYNENGVEVDGLYYRQGDEPAADEAA